LGLDHLQPRLPAAKQRREQALEVVVDGVEGALQAAAGLVVDLADAGAQLGDGRLDVALLLVEAVELLREGGEVLVGLQVDAAKPLAIGLETHALSVRLLQGGQLGAPLKSGRGQTAVGCATELLANAPSLLGPARARILKPRLDAGASFALIGHGRL